MMNQGSRGESTPGPAVLTLVVVVGKNSLAYRLPSSRPIKIPYVCTPGWEQAGIGVCVWGHRGFTSVGKCEWLSGDHGVSTLFISCEIDHICPSRRQVHHKQSKESAAHPVRPRHGPPVFGIQKKTPRT